MILNKALINSYNILKIVILCLIKKLQLFNLVNLKNSY